MRVIYAHDSADSTIEAMARQLGSEGRAVTTATSDGGVATACNVHGATVVSSKWLVTELKASRNAGKPARWSDGQVVKWPESG